MSVIIWIQRSAAVPSDEKIFTLPSSSTSIHAEVMQGVTGVLCYDTAVHIEKLAG